LSVVTVESFDEIGECRVKILILCVQLSGLHIQACL
jgi:hypothetical protein